MPAETILIVDDEPSNLAVLSQVLQHDYRVRAAISGKQALLAAASEPRPDLVLLDIMMPAMDGHQVLKGLRRNPVTVDIPVVFLTSLADSDDEENGLLSGASDYVTKPIRPRVLLARVRNQLELKRARDRLAGQNTYLEAEITRRMAEGNLAQLVSIRALAHLAEMRDNETGTHILRTQEYVRTLAQHLSTSPRRSHHLDAHYIDLLTRSAPLHDIGKVGIPDSILLKPGPLSADEWAVMKTHARLGSDAIERVEADVEQPVLFLTTAKEIARSHHEKWDGSGYPDGLCGDAIPLSARIMAIADVFDALVTPRVYKAAMPYASARAIIAAERGRHFDPELVDIFLVGFEDYVAIAERFRDDTSAAVEPTLPTHMPSPTVAAS